MISIIETYATYDNYLLTSRMLQQLPPPRFVGGHRKPPVSLIRIIDESSNSRRPPRHDKDELDPVAGEAPTEAAVTAPPDTA
jgi:hypothetical protein